MTVLVVDMRGKALEAAGLLSSQIVIAGNR